MFFDVIKYCNYESTIQQKIIPKVKKARKNEDGYDRWEIVLRITHQQQAQLDPTK
jgi:hypothetical protein